MDSAKKTLSEFLAVCERPFVGFSGGKDSAAVLILLSQMGRLDVPIFTQGDDLDFPNKREYCERTVRNLGFTDYTYAWSDVSALAQLSHCVEAEIHGTFTHVIQRYMRERNRNGVIMGLRAEESHGRRALSRTRGPIYTVRGGEMRCIPLHDWRGEDVFALILSTDTPYMHVYDHDGERAPHTIRFSWMVNPAFVDRGEVAWLRRYYPDIYNRLLLYAPGIARFT